MLTLFSGTGLGLFDINLRQYENSTPIKSGNNSSFPTDSLALNLARGNLILQQADQNVFGLGGSSQLLRTYNSQGQTDDSFRFSFEKRLRLEGAVNAVGSRLLRQSGDGFEQVFIFDESTGIYRSAQGEGADDTITYDDSTASWRYLEGTSRQREEYNEAGQLQRWIDKAGQAIEVRYNAAGNVSEIEDASGQITRFNYNGNLLQSVATISAGDTHTRLYYHYDNLQRLSAVLVDESPEDNDIADGAVYKTEYLYDGDSNRVSEVITPQGSRLSISYQAITLPSGETQWRVSELSDGNGNDTRIVYDLEQRSTSVFYRLQEWTYVYDENDRLIEEITPPVDGQRQVSEYRYNEDGKLVEKIDADGHSWTTEYDTYNNVVAQQECQKCTQ